MDDLKPCPFCGSIDVEEKQYGDNEFWVSCADCGARISEYEDYDEAIEAWNRRADDGRERGCQ